MGIYRASASSQHNRIESNSMYSTCMRVRERKHLFGFRNGILFCFASKPGQDDNEAREHEDTKQQQ